MVIKDAEQRKKRGNESEARVRHQGYVIASMMVYWYTYLRELAPCSNLEQWMAMVSDPVKAALNQVYGLRSGEPLARRDKQEPKTFPNKVIKILGELWELYNDDLRRPKSIVVEMKQVHVMLPTSISINPFTTKKNWTPETSPKVFTRQQADVGVALEALISALAVDLKNYVHYLNPVPENLTRGAALLGNAKMVDAAMRGNRSTCARLTGTGKGRTTRCYYWNFPQFADMLERVSFSADDQARVASFCKRIHDLSKAGPPFTTTTLDLLFDGFQNVLGRLATLMKTGSQPFHFSTERYFIDGVYFVFRGEVKDRLLVFYVGQTSLFSIRIPQHWPKLDTAFRDAEHKIFELLRVQEKKIFPPAWVISFDQLEEIFDGFLDSLRVMVRGQPRSSFLCIRTSLEYFPGELPGQKKLANDRAFSDRALVRCIAEAFIAALIPKNQCGTMGVLEMFVDPNQDLKNFFTGRGLPPMDSDSDEERTLTNSDISRASSASTFEEAHVSQRASTFEEFLDEKRSDLNDLSIIHVVIAVLTTSIWREKKEDSPFIFFLRSWTTTKHANQCDLITRKIPGIYDPEVVEHFLTNIETMYSLRTANL